MISLMKSLLGIIRFITADLFINYSTKMAIKYIHIMLRHNLRKLEK
jgi:hypothetical protein